MSMSTDFNRRTGGAFRFRLRTMLLAVTLCGVACAVMQAVGPAWSAILGFGLLLVAMHVLGNAIGTRLRDDATADAACDTDERPRHPASFRRPVRSKELARRAPLGRWIVLVTAIGVAGGGTLGEIFLFGNSARTAVAVGTISSAVIGGFAAFLTSSFLCVGASALWQAHCDKGIR